MTWRIGMLRRPWSSALLIGHEGRRPRCPEALAIGVASEIIATPEAESQRGPDNPPRVDRATQLPTGRYFSRFTPASGAIAKRQGRRTYCTGSGFVRYLGD